MAFGVNHECTIIENYRICSKQELRNITGNGCIENALRGVNASCPYEEQRDEMDIRPIDGHTLVIKNAVQPILLDSSCNIKTRKITGTLLITYPNCSITINGAKYDDRKTTDHHDIKLISTIGVNFQATVVFDKPDLERVNLLRIENRDHIHKLRKDHTTLQHTTSGFLSLFAAIIVGLIILSLRKQLGFFRKQHEKSTEVNSYANTESIKSSLSTDQNSTEIPLEQAPNSIPMAHTEIHLNQQPRFHL